MRYYKTTDADGFVAVNTLNADGDGNITQAEYEYIVSLLVSMPSGKRLHDDGNGEYSYVDIPPVEDILTDEELLSIILGGES